MRVKKGPINSIFSPTIPITLSSSSSSPLALEMPTLSIIENEFDYKLKESGKSWVSSYKVESSNKIFEKNNSGNILKQGSSGQVNKIFKPMRIFLSILGRFPFSPTTVRAKGLASPTFSYTMKTFHWIYFIITTFFLIFVLLTSTLGFVNFILNWNFGVAETEFYELECCIFKKNLVPFVLFWGCLVHVAVGNISFITNRKKIVDYLNNWNMVIDIINIDLPSSLGIFLLFSSIWILCFVLTFITFFTFNIAPIARNSSSLVANLIVRPFIPGTGIDNFKQISPMSILGMFILLYGIYSSRALLIIYLFKTRLLRHSFKIWNLRLKEQIYSEKNEHDIFSEKIVSEKLYQDHYILVRMVKQTDTVFGTMLQSYYATQILNMCFELFYLARSSVFHPEVSDIVVAAILLTQTVSFFLAVSLDAAYVNEEAMKGFEVLRSRGLRSDDSSNKKHLIYSLEMSYSQRIVLTGGKFFSLDRPFIVTVLGAVFTYFVIILQFGPGQVHNGKEICGERPSEPTGLKIQLK